MEPLLQTSLPKVSLLSAVFLILALLCFSKLRSKPRERARRRKSVLARLGRALLSLVLFLVALALVGVAGGVYWVGKQLQQFEMVSPSSTLVGSIECLWKDQEAHQALVQYTPFSGESADRAQIYRITGEEVSISGEVLRWDAALRILGFRDCYQTTRLGGWTRGPGGRGGTPDTLCWLGGGPRPIYLLIQSHEQRLPFVSTAEAEPAFLVPDEDTQHTIHMRGTTYSAVPVKVRIGGLAPPEEAAAKQ
jgi:hypothetical protein